MGHASHLTIPIPDVFLERIAQKAAEIVLEHHEDMPDYLDTAATAQYLGWPKKRIDNLCSKRLIPFYKSEGRRIFVRQEIDCWVQEQRV